MEKVFSGHIKNMAYQNPLNRMEHLVHQLKYKNTYYIRRIVVYSARNKCTVFFFAFICIEMTRFNYFRSVGWVTKTRGHFRCTLAVRHSCQFVLFIEASHFFLLSLSIFVFTFRLLTFIVDRSSGYVNFVLIIIAPNGRFYDPAKNFMCNTHYSHSYVLSIRINGIVVLYASYIPNEISVISRATFMKGK